MEIFSASLRPNKAGAILVDAVNSTWLVMASRIEMVELIKGFVVNFELLLNVKLIVGTTFLINGHGLNYYKSDSHL